MTRALASGIKGHERTPLPAAADEGGISFWVLQSILAFGPQRQSPLRPPILSPFPQFLMSLPDNDMVTLPSIFLQFLRLWLRCNSIGHLQF